MSRRLPGVGHVLPVKENPMKRFLRDVLVGFLASFLAAVAAHFLSL
ncbi:hypothetical protein [Bilophila wadsworthia]